MKHFLLVVLVYLRAGCLPILAQSGDEQAAEEYLEQENEMAQVMIFDDTLTAWTYNTNITDHNEDVMVSSSLILSKFTKEVMVNASSFDYQHFENQTLKRIFTKLVDVGTAALSDETKLEKLAKVVASMEGTYSTGQVFIKGEGELKLDPGLTRLMAESRDYDTLQEAWVGWRDASGKKMRGQYQEFVSLSNEAIRADGFNDTGEYWRSWYESDTFQEDLVELYEQISPLYENLHIYVRRKLRELYGAKHFPSTGHIPAHLLGNMWAQDWTNLLARVQPYDRESVDVTSAMVEQNYTAKRMFKVAEEFFTSLGLFPMTEEFWNNSMITRPTDREVVCHASAWDFFNQRDFRIKMCTDITMSDLITIHHEMGHIQYYQQYKDQPVPFRAGANPGFHEAIGDVLALSVSTPKHLKEIGLLKNASRDRDSNINYLMSIALDKIAFLPFGYLTDQWRWDVFNGKTKSSEYNQKWWDLRCKFQGVSPPVERSEDDFDPGAKFHIPANTPYIRYFVSTIIQFQFHKALCEAANQTGPLDTCDIYRSREAGDLLSDVLQIGSSKPWTDAMEIITGQRKMDAGPLLEYFADLVDWLEKANKDAGDTKGWSDGCPDLSPNSSPVPAFQWTLLSLPILHMLLK